MLKIAICDDEEQCKDNIRVALSHIEEKWKTNINDKYFSSGKELYENLIENTYDVILLDILMDDDDEIEVAKKISEMGVNSYIVFISSFQERWRELFGTKTIDFLDKPVDVDKLEIQLKQVLNLLKSEKDDVFIYKINGVEKFLFFKDIIYFESVNQRVEIVAVKETIAINDTLKNIWNRLKINDNFIMPSRSYIVNLKYTNMINSDSFVISSHNLEISVGRTMKKEVSKRYLKFIRRV